MNIFKKLFSKKDLATNFPKIVIGKIITVEAHPNADRLKLTLVDVGEKLKIVCGAPNIEPGQFVPVALVGAQLPNGEVIQQATIRGVDSFGMLCAADELGLGTDHSGVMVFSEATVGEPIDKYISNFKF